MKTITKIMSAVTLSVGLLGAGSAHAAVTCEMVISAVDVSGNGAVFVSGNGAGVKFDHDLICSTGVATGQYTADACKELSKLLNASLLSGKKVVMWFNGPSATCTPPAWTDLANGSYGFYHAALYK